MLNPYIYSLKKLNPSFLCLRHKIILFSIHSCCNPNPNSVSMFCIFQSWMIFMLAFLEYQVFSYQDPDFLSLFIFLGIGHLLANSMVVSAVHFPVLGILDPVLSHLFSSPGRVVTLSADQDNWLLWCIGQPLVLKLLSCLPNTMSPSLYRWHVQLPAAPQQWVQFHFIPKLFCATLPRVYPIHFSPVKLLG